MANTETIKQGFSYLGTVFHKDIDPLREKVFISLLADLPDDLFRAAVKHCAATCTFFPVPGEIRAAAAHLAKMVNRVPSADEAWGELLNAHAPIHTPVYCSKSIEIHNLCNSDPEHYWQHIHELKEHDEICNECYTKTTDYQFSHPLILEVATRLGWPSRFWSSEIGVDRGRFMKTYDAAIQQLTGQALLLPDVREYIDDQTARLEDRRAVFDTGEAKQIQRQYSELARRME